MLFLGGPARERYPCFSSPFPPVNRFASTPRPVSAFLQTEATEVFFAVTKLFQSKDPSLRRMVYLIIKEISPSSDEARLRLQSLHPAQSVTALDSITCPYLRIASLGSVAVCGLQSSDREPICCPPCHTLQVIIVTSSLMKDMNSKQDLYRANAIRVLFKIIDSGLLTQIERYLKQAVVDKNSVVASSALVRFCPTLSDPAATPLHNSTSRVSVD